MKYIFFSFLVFALIWTGCSPAGEASEERSAQLNIPEILPSAVIYEVNLRQYTPEGTINAFTRHLDRLRNDLGVDILWIMPTQPIGVKNRKGELGSYYSIRDYTAINPEFGTMEDFKRMVQQAHDKGMMVILDWVANHTAWDHVWMDNEDYYVRDSAGNINAPYDWTDVAELNYENMDMQDDMIREMMFWVEEVDIDGFRCDVAGEVPMSFWSRAIDSLESRKEVFMLAEWDEPRMHPDFKMTYGWGFHHVMNEVAKGHMNADSVRAFIEKDNERYPETAFRMNFITNHDENSWNGTIEERLGDGHKAFAALYFTIQGMPLIYSGQEAGLDKRLAFFTKDTISWDDLELQSFYAALIDFKKENEALHNGEYGGDIHFMDTGNEHVIAFYRESGDNRVYAVINLSDSEQAINIDDELGFEDMFMGNTIEGGEKVMMPYAFHIGTKL